MRHFNIAAALVLVTVSTSAQTASPANAQDAAPPLTQSVAVDPTDSPLVRAAKLAVASRKHPNARRVITINSSGESSRGRFAEATGPTKGPSVPAPPAPPAQQQDTPQIREAKRKAHEENKKRIEERLRQLSEEEGAMGVELDEPYGADVEEDAADARMTEIAEERERLQRQLQQPPPPQQ